MQYIFLLTPPHMIDRYIFNEGFLFLRNPLDGWSYLSTYSWYKDFTLLNKLFAADKEALSLLCANNDRVKIFELLLAFEQRPVLANIILEHYRLPYDHLVFVDFIKFLLNKVEVEMNDLADCVALRKDQTPFDFLPFEPLMAEYQFITRREIGNCQYLKPMGLEIHHN